MKTLLRDNRFLAAVLLLLFLFIHLYALDELPGGLNTDEVGTAYDAWCLANYGVDRHRDPFPVYPINYGDGQSAMYGWVLTALIALTGTVNTFIIRLPAALFGLILMAFGALTAHEVLGEKHPKAWFAFGLFYLVCPYFTMAARFGLDCNLLAGMSTAFLYAVVRAARRGRMRDYALAGIAAGLTLYTYAVSYMIMALFLLLALVYLARVRLLRWKNVLAAALPLVLIAWPLVAVQVINLFDLPEVTLFGKITLPRIPDYRAGEFGLSNPLRSLFNALKSTLMYDDRAANSTPQFWTMYPISVPFVLIGAIALLARGIRAVRTRAHDCAFFPLLWGALALAVGVTLSGDALQPNTNQMNGIFFAAALSAVTGIYTVLDWLRGNVRRAAAAAIATAYAACGGLFFHWYFIERSQDALFEAPMSEAIAFIEANDELAGRTVCMSQHYTYYLYATLPSPYDYSVPESGPFGDCGNYHFEPSDFVPPYDPESIYVVSQQYDAHIIEEAGFQPLQVGNAIVYLPADIDANTLVYPEPA